MPQEQMTPITAAAIALLSSVLSFLLATGYKIIDDGIKRNRQIEDDNKKREWQKEDDDKRRKQQTEDFILARRIEAIKVVLPYVHKFLDKYQDLIMKLVDAQLTLISNVKPVDELGNSSKDLIELINDAEKFSTYVYSFGDEALITLVISMSEIYNQEHQKFAELLLRKINDKEIVENIEHKRIIEFRKKTMELKIMMSKRLNELSGFGV